MMNILGLNGVIEHQNNSSNRAVVGNLALEQTLQAPSQVLVAASASVSSALAFFILSWRAHSSLSSMTLAA